MKSIRRQLTQQLVLGSLLIAGCGGTAAYITMRAAVLRQFDEALLGKAGAVCALTMQGRNGRPHLEVEDVRSLGFTDDGSDHYFQIRLLNGKSIARSPSVLGGELPSLGNSASTPEFRDITLPGGAVGRAVAFTFLPRAEDEDDEEKHSQPAPVPAEIIVASSRQSLNSTLRLMLTALGLSTAVLVVGAWLMVPRILRRGFRPLDVLADRVTGIDADSLATRFPETGVPAEIAPIARRLNDLFERIGASFERERRFSADLAHELRTPLAELRSQAELALKWPDARATTADADTLAITLRMEHLVTRLLAIARAEGGHADVVSERVDMGSAVQTAWRPFAGRAAAKGLRVAFDLPLDLAVECDPALLREILANLFSNAVDHTPASGEVNVAANLTSGTFSLSVSNTVQGLDAADVEKMFDRFWRKEASRSDDEHAGLGLALARCYAKSLDWKLEASLDDSQRLTFTLGSRKSGVFPSPSSCDHASSEKLNSTSIP